jgi:hypothetical protein
MSKADFYRELLSDVEERVVSGETADSAIMLVALGDEKVDGAVLKKWIIKQHGSEQDLEAWARRESDRRRLRAALGKELASCRQREGAYGNLPLFPGEATQALIQSRLELEVGRPLSAHEVWMIEEDLKPWFSEWKLASQAKVKPLRTVLPGA